MTGRTVALSVRKAHPRYTTTAELADRWQVSVITIHRLIEQGDLTGLKIRGRYRISRVSVEAYESRVSF
ncbi:MAG: helix-turn-helix domain-containing protein [Nitrospinae bacterium]|nr:helix-turn-helix domain-containing protein [Nitrospinota bacterium]